MYFTNLDTDGRERRTSCGSSCCVSQQRDQLKAMEKKKSLMSAKGHPSHTTGLPATHRSPCRAQKGIQLHSASRQCQCGSSNAPACCAVSSPPLAYSSHPAVEAAPTRQQQGAISGAGTATTGYAGKEVRALYNYGLQSHICLNLRERGGLLREWQYSGSLLFSSLLRAPPLDFQLNP